MSDFDENNNNPEEQVTNESQQTLTLDGKVYAMSSLPAEAINVLNDLIRSENELNEHRFRIRTLSAAQQSLTAALNQFIGAAGIEPLPATDSDQENDSQSDEEG